MPEPVPLLRTADPAAGHRRDFSVPGRARRHEQLLWPWLLALLPLVPLLILALSARQPVQRFRLDLRPGEAVLSPPFRLESGLIGSPGLDLRAEIPDNSALLYRMELLDREDRVLLELSREGWRESGFWSEEGVSGRWEESDLALPLLLRPARSGLHRLRLTLDELNDAAGLPRADPAPVPMLITLSRHRVDGPLLALTAISALAITACAWMAIYGHCRRRRRLQVAEAGLRLRDEFGPGLLRIAVCARYATTRPNLLRRPSAPLRLRVEDGFGRIRLRHRGSLRLWGLGWSEEEGCWLGRHRLHLRLDRRCSLRFSLALPARLADSADELASLTLVLEDGVRVPGPVPVLELPWNGR